MALVLPALPAAAQDNISSGLNSIGSAFNHSGELTGSTTASGLIRAIIRYLLYFCGMIAVVFLIYGGYQYITSAGNTEKAEKGRTILVDSIIGLLIIGLSYVIVTVVVNLIQGYR